MDSQQPDGIPTQSDTNLDHVEDKGKYLILRNTGAKKPTFYAPMSGKRYLDGQQRKPVVDFIGQPNFDDQSSPLWKMSMSSVRERFERYYETKEELPLKCPLKMIDLPQPRSVPVGMVESGVVLYAKNPSDFYILLEKPGFYKLEESEWNRIFPEFKTGPEAFRGLQMLLNWFYQRYDVLGIRRKVSFDQPEVGTLVVVKAIKKVKHSVEEANESGAEKEEIMCQFRRGIVTYVELERKINNPSLLFTVYLLDFGYDVIVSEWFLHPLMKPFNYIAPLALRCCLFGISSVAEEWDSSGIQYFHDTLLKYRDASFAFEFRQIPIQSIYQSVVPVNRSYLVSVDVRKYNMETKSIEYLLNITEEMIKMWRGIPWNLFPSRPKVMRGTNIYVGKGEPSSRNKDGGDVPFRTAMLLTPYLPRLYEPLPETVLKRELDRLFRMRSNALDDVMGMHNRLILRLPDPKKQLGKPASVMISCQEAKALVAAPPIVDDKMKDEEESNTSHQPAKMEK
ncbi:unnamed protein product [Orchesella dallaii]|uniref:Uncharacterized protein n=1 Tax=Orchesella dallaii TaxID=48710 RepID=A0ABP1QJF3_9HEXA